MNASSIEITSGATVSADGTQGGQPYSSARYGLTIRSILSVA